MDKDADEIVTYVKESTKDVYSMMAENIDFMGCSESYVAEKIDALIYSLKELKRHCKSVNKRQNATH